MPIIPTQVIPSVDPALMSTRQVRREFSKLIDSGAKIRPAGEAKADPLRLLREGYAPKSKIELFGTRFYLTNPRQNPALRFFVAYVVQPHRTTGKLEIYPRIFYKDLSLIWRCASHMIASDQEFWIGKGAVRTVCRGGFDVTECVEATTDLPLEMQTALEMLNRRVRRVPMDEEALFLVLRRAPGHRTAPYRDFSEPRRRAAENRRNLIHGGRSIARFTRKNDPSSLQIVPGFEPNFRSGIVEKSVSKSAMYGGKLQRFRVISRNERVQYFFMAGPKHAWIIPPQALTTELSSYGVRTIDVVADEDLFVPGYEYHYFDPAVDPCEHFSQIPAGFAGEPSEHDGDRADASAWLDEIPVIQQFRRQVLRPEPRR